MNSSLRKDILETIQRAGVGDIGVSLAVVDVLAALYFGEENGVPLLKVDGAKPQWEERDRVVLSDGAMWPAQQVCLMKSGFSVSPHDKRPTLKISGVDAAMGLPGQGLSLGWGMAQSFQMDKRKNRTYVVLTDDDLSCGSTWEAAMGIAHDRLDHLMALCAYTGAAKREPLQDKFEAFGWKVFKVVDGHDEAEIIDAIARAKEVPRMPSVVLAPVVLGRGVPFAEGKLEYRGALFSEAEMQEALQHLT